MIEDMSWFDRDKIIDELKALDLDTRNYCSIIDYVTDPCILDLLSMLDSEFSSELGRPAYSSLRLLTTFLFAEEWGYENYSDIERLCKVNDIFKIINPDKAPTYNTFERFLRIDENEKDEEKREWYEKKSEIFLSIFLFIIVRMNDYHFLDNVKKNFLDGTDAKLNASVNNLISEDEIEALELMGKWGLIHDLSEKKMRNVELKVKCKLRYYKNNPEITRLIGLILKRIELYNKHVYAKISEFKLALEDSNKNYVSITFPEGVKMKGKSGRWEIGLNLQELMTENNIVLLGLLIRKPNDGDALKEVAEAVEKNIEILKKLQKEYGERNNPKHLENLFLKNNTFCDAGYDTEKNNKSNAESEMNFIIITRKAAREINKKIKNKNTIHPGKPKNKTKKKNKNTKKDQKEIEDYGIMDCTRVKNGYICPYNHHIDLIKVNELYTKKTAPEGLPEVLWKSEYIHKCKDCENCPYFRKHGKKCSVANYIEETSKYHYELTNEFIDGKYKKPYRKRMGVSEGINAYLKGRKGILLLLGHNLKTAMNHMHLKNLLYNIKRFVKLKGTAW